MLAEVLFMLGDTIPESRNRHSQGCYEILNYKPIKLGCGTFRTRQGGRVNGSSSKFCFDLCSPVRRMLFKSALYVLRSIIMVTVKTDRLKSI
jgi:hypothetical protein